MPRLGRNAVAVALLAVLAGLGACREASSDPVPAEAASPAPCANGWRSGGEPPPAVAVMTSLPFFFPLGADMADVLSGAAPMPWQQFAFGHCYSPVALDTLSPASGVAPDIVDAGPLGGHERLAVIQPRGLSPADNVALDAWVRRGGRLLLMLDPALTGEYDIPLGDPRRPSEGTLIPPVVARWGMAIRFDETQEPVVRNARIDEVALPLVLSGQIAITDPAAAQCALLADGAAARCTVGKGRVTLIADAALFEHQELAGKDGATVQGLLAAAFE
ncbi:hypothetical protein [Erythrobacter donghaensis]|uniref:hypothetical protein n=1 Tax=Erythrobacter donghaensis TaxID=267135 RepID=UPI000A3B8A4F|nr:hypothetical protein [Erythrobacter donghaensis]